MDETLFEIKPRNGIPEFHFPELSFSKGLQEEVWPEADLRTPGMLGKVLFDERMRVEKGSNGSTSVL